MSDSRFRTLVLQALKEFAKTGYSTEADLQEWLSSLHAALEDELPTDEQPGEKLDAALERVFEHDIDSNGMQQRAPDERFALRYTISRDLEPALRAELNRLRFFASGWNKAAAIQKMLQCFSDWVRSVPRGGTSQKNFRAVSKEIRELVVTAKYERRCAAIDLGYKINAAVAHVVAVRQGAIAGVWHDGGEEVQAEELGHGARPEHLERSGTMFLVRNSWAMKEGLIKKGGLHFMDEIERPAEPICCLCSYEYVTSLRNVPPELLTAKGREWLETAVATTRTGKE